MARFKPKKLRDQSPRAQDVNFEFYAWENEIEAGWHPAVVLNSEEAWTNKTKKKHPACFEDDYTGEMPEADMWKLTFGLDMPGGIGGRVMWWVPFAFPPKVEMMQATLLREHEDADEEFEASPKALIFKTCALLVEEDTEFEREDGKQSWKIAKLVPLDLADEKLGVEWRTDRKGAAADSTEDTDESDCF